MCGGFTCTKNALTALNILYILVSFILILVAAYGRAANQVTNIAIVGGIIACGVFLFILSLLGLVGARKHHQYMVILFILFVVQFSIACACLAFGTEQQVELARKGWENAPRQTQQSAQTYFNCCGFAKSKEPLNITDCPNIKCCIDFSNCSKDCVVCGPQIKKAIANALEISGWVGMFFSFTELIAVWLAFKFRGYRNPELNPYRYFHSKTEF